MSYKKQREWSDLFMPSVKSILGKVIIIESTFKEDTEEGFDLITPEQKRIACRVRDYERYKKYIQEFTIRSQSYHNRKTEIDKIIQEKRGDWMFYGFTKGNEVIYWSIINLDVFRSNHKSAHYKERKNLDGTKFRAYSMGSFPQNIIISSNIDIQFGLEKVSQYLLPFPTHR